MLSYQLSSLSIVKQHLNLWNRQHSWGLLSSAVSFGNFVGFTFTCIDGKLKQSDNKTNSRSNETFIIKLEVFIMQGLRVL